MTVQIIRKATPQQDALRQAPIATNADLLPIEAIAPVAPNTLRLGEPLIEERVWDARPAVRIEKSWNAPGRDRPAPGRTVTLATVLTNLEASHLASTAKRDISWAVRTFAHGTGRTPSDIAASSSVIRGHLEAMSPAMLGLRSTASFYNLKSLLRRAVRLTGAAARPRARAKDVTLDAEWSLLFKQLPRRARARLGGFITYCSAEGYAPARIETGHVQRYASALESEGINSKWAGTITRMVQEWNQAVVEFDFWPNTTVQTPWPPKKAFTPRLEEFSEAYQQSVEDYLGYLRDPPIEDELAPLKGLREGSVRTRLFLLRYMAAVLRTRGWSEAELSSVNSLVEAKALDVLLQYASPQPDGKGRAQYVVRLVVLKSIAKYWAAMPKSVIDHISRLIGRHAIKTHAMAPVNRQKLAELSSVDVRASLLNLAPNVFKALHERPSSELTERDANLALAALYVELATMWPGRVGTLSKIHLTKNLVRSGQGRTMRVFLHFVAGEIKNGVPVEVELPPHLVALLDTFANRYRPLLIHKPSDYLFPAKCGGPRSPSTIYKSVTSITRRYVGRPVNPNLFRHFMSTLYLERRPGDYETVRRVLVHTSLDMAHQHYIGIEDRAAAGRFDEVILQIREESSQGRHRRRTGPSSPVPSPRKARASGRRGKFAA